MNADDARSDLADPAGEVGAAMPGSLPGIRSVLALSLTVFTVYFMTVAFIPSTLMRYVHGVVGLCIVFLGGRITSGRSASWSLRRWLDYGLTVAAVLSLGYLIVEVNDLPYRYGNPTSLDILAGGIVLILILEFTRRRMGWVLPLIVVVCIAYAVFGDALPGYIGHGGYDVERVITRLVLAEEGAFGILFAVYVRIIFIFILLGSVLLATGASDFMTDLALAWFGRLRGGPAYAAVAASAGVGSFTGLGVSNVATTGVVTIPLMKRQGYPAEVAGGIEAAASTGGQLLPPVMGTAAFAMAELTGIPYTRIAAVSILPALLYFASLAIYVWIRTAKLGIPKANSATLPKAGPLLRSSSFLLLPVILLVILIFAGFTISYSGLIATAFAILLNLMDKKRRLSIAAWKDVVARSVWNSMTIMGAVLCSGLILGVMTTTGLGLKLTNLVVGLGHDQLLLTLVLIYLVSMVFGMGLPVLASYVLVAIFAAPTLTAMGVPLLAAHLFILWTSVDANLTPPVALASYTAAAIAEGDPVKTSVSGWLAGKALYVVPLFIVYDHLAFTDGVAAAVIGAGACFLVLVAISAVVSRHLFVPMRGWELIFATVGAVALIPNGIWAKTSGLALLGLVLSSQLSRRGTLVAHSLEVDAEQPT